MLLSERGFFSKLGTEGGQYALLVREVTLTGISTINSLGLNLDGVEL